MEMEIEEQKAAIEEEPLEESANLVVNETGELTEEAEGNEGEENNEEDNQS